MGMTVEKPCICQQFTHNIPCFKLKAHHNRGNRFTASGRIEVGNAFYEILSICGIEWMSV